MSTARPEIKLVADDPKIGMTLDDMKELVRELESAGCVGTARVKARVGFHSQIRSMWATVVPPGDFLDAELHKLARQHETGPA